jgi:hypothetical protein
MMKRKNMRVLVRRAGKSLLKSERGDIFAERERERDQLHNPPFIFHVYIPSM